MVFKVQPKMALHPGVAVRLRNDVLGMAGDYLVIDDQDYVHVFSEATYTALFGKVEEPSEDSKPIDALRVWKSKRVHRRLTGATHDGLTSQECRILAYLAESVKTHNRAVTAREIELQAKKIFPDENFKSITACLNRLFQQGYVGRVHDGVFKYTPTPKGLEVSADKIEQSFRIVSATYLPKKEEVLS